MYLYALADGGALKKLRFDFRLHFSITLFFVFSPSTMTATKTHYPIKKEKLLQDRFSLKLLF